MSNEQIIKGVIFSHFGDQGPEPKFWFPSSLDKDMLIKISLKTISLLAGESGETISQQAYLQFPNYSLSSLVYLFGIPKEEVRGKNVAASISMLIKDKYSSLFYVNMSEIEELMEDYIPKIVEKELNDDSSQELLINLYNQISEKINILSKQKITTYKVKEKEIEDKEDLVNRSFKIAIVGDLGVGKTAMLLRFCEQAFRDVYISTNGANINMNTIEIENKYRITLNLWDVSGQECYLEMNEKLIKGCDAIIYVYDITRRDSFSRLKFWYDWVRSTIGYKIGVLVGNKLDLKNRVVSKDEAKELAKDLRLGYIETSAKNGINLKILFENLSKAILKLYKNI
ncbi:MAG: GTP-binding protein [Candidatus Lokiarchaeota archaeon]|nr:GTP-binding protein [Candidatus Lokiarchaeota archaeon]